MLRCCIRDTNLSGGHEGGGPFQQNGVRRDIPIGGNLVEVRGDILQKRTITHETSGVDVTGDVEHIGPRVVHVQVGTHVEIVDGCGVGNANLSSGHEGGGPLQQNGVGGDVSISGNLVKVRGDVFQKGTVADESCGVDVTGDMEHIGPRVVHVQIGTYI